VIVISLAPAQDQTLPDHLPTTATLRFLFTRYLNISAVPRRSFFEIIYHFTSSDIEREKLGEFASLDGAVGRYQLAIRDRQSTFHLRTSCITIVKRSDGRSVRSWRSLDLLKFLSTTFSMYFLLYCPGVSPLLVLLR
jgi:hypothetical protein